MDAHGHGGQPTSAARLSPVASTSSYFLQLDATGRIEIMDSSMVQAAGGTRTIELGSGGSGGEETVYEIRDDDYTFLSGQFMEQGLQEIDPVDITDLLEKPMQSYSVEDSNNSNTTSTFTTLTSATSGLPHGYEGISIMDTSGRIHHQQNINTGGDSILGVSTMCNNQISSVNTSFSGTPNSSSVVLCANSFPLTNIMNSSNVQLLSHSIPISSMNCDIIDPNQMSARVVVSSQETRKSPVVISEPIQIMQQGMQHPIAVIHVPELTGQSSGASAQSQDFFISQGQTVQQTFGRTIAVNQNSDDEVKIVYSNQNSQPVTVQSDEDARTLNQSQSVSVISQANSSTQLETDVSVQTVEELDRKEEDDEMDIKIVSCYSQRSESEVDDVSSKTSVEATNDPGEENDKTDDVESVLSGENTDKVSSEVKEEKDPILVRKPVIHPWLSCCVDEDDELLTAFTNRPLKDCNKTSICGFCYEWLDDDETLKEHTKLKHGQLKLYDCETCGARFIARIYLQRHLKLHKYDLTLPWCRYSSEDLSPFSLKTNNHFTQRFRPAPFSDTYREHLNGVLDRIQSLPYDCFDCGESFPEEELARDHYERHHATHTCRQCCEVLDTWEDFIDHKQSYHGEYSIDENYIGGAWFLWEHWLCEESVKKEELISNICYFHNYCVAKEKESPVFVEEFVDASTLIDEANDREKDLKSTKDNELSESGDTVDSSLYNSDSSEENTEVSANVKQPARRRVKKRPQVDLSEEMYSATTLPFKCDQCPKSYDNEHDLKRHGRCHSIDKQPLTCQYCQKSFKTHSHKKEHERTHTGEKPYTCPICNRSFIQSSNLKKHIQTHKSENTLQCKICNKQFIKESSLVLHQRAHALDRKFRCEVCDRAYNYASLLKRHMRIHTGELPYSCDVCGMLFHELVSLHYHRKKVHTGERPHKCDICGRAFILSSDLKKHHQIHTKSPSERATAPKMSRRRSQIKSTESDSSRNEGDVIMEQDETPHLDTSEISNQDSVPIVEVPFTQASVITENHNVLDRNENKSPKKDDEMSKEIRAMQDLESNLNHNEEDEVVSETTKPKPPILRVYQKSPPKKQSILRPSQTLRIAPAPTAPIPVIQPVPTESSSTEKPVSVIQHAYTPNVSNVTLSHNSNTTTSDVSFVQLSNNGEQASYVIVSYDGVSMMAIPQSAVSESTTLHLQEATSVVPVTNSQNTVISQPFQTHILDGQRDVYSTNFESVISGTNSKDLEIQSMEILHSNVNVSDQKANDVDIMNDFNNIIVEAPDVSEEVTVNECDSLMAWD